MQTELNFALSSPGKQSVKQADIVSSCRVSLTIIFVDNNFCAKEIKSMFNSCVDENVLAEIELTVMLSRHLFEADDIYIHNLTKRKLLSSKQARLIKVLKHLLFIFFFNHTCYLHFDNHLLLL